MRLASVVFLFLFISLGTINSQPEKIICIGASITEGVGTGDHSKNSFPAQLGTLLGDKYEVLNYGVSGRTLLRNGNLPYWKTDAYQSALKSNPDIVFIDLGGNDAKGINRTYYNEMTADCRDIIKNFADLPSKPRVILMLPLVSFEPDTNQIWDPVIVNRIIPCMRQAAYEENVEVLDMHPLLLGKRDFYADNIHPNTKGATVIAERLYEQVMLKTDDGFDVFKNINLPYKTEMFGGYECADFVFEGRNSKIVKPRKAAKGHPWVWRMRFWGHEPQADIALLERGFHVIYCDASELMGNKECISLWDKFHKMVHKAGLSKKGALEGMSRGGVYAFNWAAKNPDKVSCVYVDNPLLDCKYFADKTTEEFTKRFMAAYNLKTKEDVENFEGSPIDKIKDIVRGKYPILILCGDADEVVSPHTNTFLFEQKIKAAGGDITVLVKSGFKHHPHSLPDPSPIVRFITEATYTK